MAFDIDQIFNSQYNIAEVAQFSTKTLEDYSIVSRKRLDKIVNNSERCLVNMILFYVSTSTSNAIIYNTTYL